MGFAIHQLDHHVGCFAGLAFAFAHDGRPLAGLEVLAQLLDLVHRELAFLVEFVLPDINTVEALNKLACRSLVLVFAVHEFGGESQHVLAQRNFGHVGRTRGQLFLDRRRQG